MFILKAPSAKASMSVDHVFELFTCHFLLKMYFFIRSLESFLAFMVLVSCFSQGCSKHWAQVSRALCVQESQSHIKWIEHAWLINIYFITSEYKFHQWKYSNNDPITFLRWISGHKTLYAVNIFLIKRTDKIKLLLTSCLFLADWW